MAKINKVINVKVEGVGKIKQLEESLKKLRKQQRDIKKDMKDGANAGKNAEQQYKKNANAIKQQSGALRETKKAMVDANNTTKKSNNLQKSMTMGVIQGAAAFSILVTAFRRVSQALVTMIGTFTDFEFTMAKVKAVSGATDEEFKRLSDSAQELGRSTFFTASEVANLQLNLSKLGFTVTEIEAATEATINLAIATGSDLARSATVAGNAVRGFQLDASETARVVDVMAVAFTSSALDIEKWQTSMTKVAPIATMAGFSIEETTAIMAKLSDTGIEASIAGTSLRNIFLKMQDPTSELTRKVGHTIHSLDDMLQMFKDMQDEGTNLADVLTFMDVRQVAAFGTMLKGADDIQALVKELENADGAGQRMADTVGDTLQGSIYKVKSALEGVSLAIVEKFGGALKKSFVSFAKWLNKIAKSPKILADIGNKIKLVIKILSWYVVGVKTAALYTKFMSSAFFTLATGAQRSATMIRIATVALKGFTRALMATGIGFVVILLAELAAGWLLSSDEAERYISTETKVELAMLDTMTAIEGVKKKLESLKKTREDINKINDESALSQEKLKLLRKQEKADIKSINGHLKTYNKELIEQKDNIDDITTATNDLITAMTDKALAQVFTDMQAVILKTKVSSDLILAKMKKGLVGESYRLSVSSNIDDIIDDLKELLKDGGIPSEGVIGQFDAGAQYQIRRAGRLNDMLEDYGITLDEFQSAIKSGYYDGEVADLESAIEGLTTTSLADLLSPPEGEEDEIIPQKYKYKLEELVSKYQADVDLTTGKLESDVKMLEAKRDALQEFLGQKGVKGTDNDEEVKGKLQLSKTLKAIDEARFKQKLESLKVELEEDKIYVQSRNLLKKDELLLLNALDAQFLEDKKQAAIDNNVELIDIENQIAKEKLESEKLKIDEKVSVLDEQYKTDQQNLNEALVNKEITEMEHQQFMLMLERAYLLEKAGLYFGYGDELKNINYEIKRNTVDTIEAQMAAMDDYLGSVGDLGQQMQDLAGDEEKLAGLRKVGVVITNAAATAEKILAIATTINTLATKKKTIADVIDVAMTGKVIAANLKKTISNISTAASGFIATISSAAKSIPFPFNIAAIALTGAAIFGAYKKIKSTFGNADTPDAGGGGGGGSSSSGGRSSSGAMSYYTYGGQHSTYADGGMVYGNSHAKGGEKFAVGGRVVELEGGEAVINKRSTSMFRSQLSAMNSVGGGVKFADGGVTNNPSFAQTQFDVTNQSSNRGSSRVVVVEADITSTQNTIKTIEAEASF